MFSEQVHLPARDAKYVFVSNFTPEQLSVIQDTSIRWQLRPFPEGVHYCDLSWEPIPGKDSKNTEGCTDGHHWITQRVYEDFIKKDIFKLRDSYPIL
jgi:hypothetical protein